MTEPKRYCQGRGRDQEDAMGTKIGREQQGAIEVDRDDERMVGSAMG